MVGRCGHSFACTKLDYRPPGAESLDRDAHRVLFDRYRARVFSFVRRRVNDEMLAEEIMVDTFFEVWRSASAYRTGETACWNQWRRRWSSSSSILSSGATAALSSSPAATCAGRSPAAY